MYFDENGRISLIYTFLPVFSVFSVMWLAYMQLLIMVSATDFLDFIVAGMHKSLAPGYPVDYIFYSGT